MTQITFMHVSMDYASQPSSDTSKRADKCCCSFQEAGLYGGFMVVWERVRAWNPKLRGAGLNWGFRIWWPDGGDAVATFKKKSSHSERLCRSYDHLDNKLYRVQGSGFRF